MAVLSFDMDLLDGLKPSLNRVELVSLMLIFLLSRLISVRVLSVLIRESRLSVLPIVRPDTFPTVPRVAVFDSRTSAIFSVDRLVMFSEPIDLPIRDGSFVSVERRLFAGDCLFVFETAGSLLPITVPMYRLRFTLRSPVEERSDERLPLIPVAAEDLLELTAGCFAFMGAEELRVPIILPIREFLLERAAVWLARLGTDGLVVLIVLPIREVMLGLIRLLVLVVDLFVIAFRDLTLDCLFLLFSKEDRLLDVVLVLIVLPIRDVMLGLILLLEFRWDKAELLLRLLELLLLDVVLVLIELPMRDVILELMRLFELLRLLMLLRLDRFDIDEFDRIVICRPNVLELGAVGRELIDRLDVLLFDDRLVMALLDILLLGVRLLMDLLEVLLLGVRLVIALLELLLLGVRLVMALLELLLLELRFTVARLELRRDDTLRELLEVFALGVDLDEDDDLEDCRLELLDRLLAAKTGSQNNKRANNVQKTRKIEPFRMDFELLILNLRFLIFPVNIIRLLSSAFAS